MKATVVTSNMDGQSPSVAVVKGTISDEHKLKIAKFLMTDPNGEVQFSEVDLCDLKPDLLDGGLRRSTVSSAGYISGENLQNGIIEK